MRIFAFGALLWLCFFAPARVWASNNPPPDLAVEVFQVLELPLNVHDASLVKSDKGYVLKLSLANSSEYKILGLRYSLLTVDYENRVQFRVNRSEGFSIRPYAAKSVTFKTPIKFKSNGERLILMLEEVISHESIWNVLKAKQAFEAYAKGDYSVMPVVLRVPNQVDVHPIMPLLPRPKY